jgi:hypothetical protein
VKREVSFVAQSAQKRQVVSGDRHAVITEHVL